MKKLVPATAAFLLLVAIPAMAYVQPGSLTQNAKAGATTTKSTRTTLNMDGGTGPGNTVTNSQSPGTGTTDPFSDVPVTGGDTPTQPVPEPGTMAMASMGLLAIGAALRHKRGR